jgi:hypothetical protein
MMTNAWIQGADFEEARRCPTCESLDHRECDNEIIRMDDPEPENEVPDFRFEDHGTIWLVHALTEGSYEHLSENVQADAQWIGNALAVEHRYARDLRHTLEGEGYIVGGDE